MVRTTDQKTTTTEKVVCDPHRFQRMGMPCYLGPRGEAPGGSGSRKERETVGEHLAVVSVGRSRDVG